MLAQRGFRLKTSGVIVMMTVVVINFVVVIIVFNIIFIAVVDLITIVVIVVFWGKTYLEDGIWQCLSLTVILYVSVFVILTLATFTD